MKFRYRLLIFTIPLLTMILISINPILTFAADMPAGVSDWPICVWVNNPAGNNNTYKIAYMDDDYIEHVACVVDDVNQKIWVYWNNADSSKLCYYITSDINQSGNFQWYGNVQSGYFDLGIDGNKTYGINVYQFTSSEDARSFLNGTLDPSDALNYDEISSSSAIHSRPTGSIGNPSNGDYFYTHYECTVYYKDGSHKLDYVFNVNKSLSADTLDRFVGLGGRPLDSEPDLISYYKWILYDPDVTHVRVTLDFKYDYSVRSDSGGVGGVKKPGRSSSLSYRITKSMLADDYDIESTESYTIDDSSETTSTSVEVSDSNNNISVVVNNNPEFNNNPGSGTGTGSNIFDVNNETYFGLPDTGDLLENVDTAFGLTGGNGYFALMNQFLDAVPSQIWTLIGMALSVSIICLVIKIFRGM